MSKTAPSVAFQALQLDMRTHSEQAAQAMLGDNAQRAWMIPSALAETSLFAPEQFHKGFDREEANADYEAALNQGGTIGEGASARLQVDYIAIQERAFRSRHLTVIRALTHAASRRLAHGDEAGIHQGVVVQHVADVLQSGKTKKPE